MYISFFIPDFFGGGAQHMIINMANEFARRGHQVDLVVVNASGPYADYINDDVRLVNLDKSRIATSFFALKKYLETQRPEIFLSALSYVNILALLVKITLRKSSTKFIVTERNHLSSVNENAHNMGGSVSKIFVRLLYPFADCVLGISKGVAEDIGKIANLPHVKIRWIHNPVVTDKTKNLLLESNSINLKSFKKSPEEALLITSGRLVEQKDYKTMFDALAYLQKHRPVRLIILGKGALEKELKKYAQDIGIDKQIEFIGFVQNPLSLIKQADLFVMSSRWEGFCNVIVEALLCGLPVVTTDCPSGPAEILGDNQYGFLVPVQDYVALAAAIEDVLSGHSVFDPETQKQRAMDFSVETICDQYESLMHEILESTA